MFNIACSIIISIHIPAMYNYGDAFMGNYRLHFLCYIVAMCTIYTHAFPIYNTGDSVSVVFPDHTGVYPVDWLIQHCYTGDMRDRQEATPLVAVSTLHHVPGRIYIYIYIASVMCVIYNLSLTAVVLYMTLYPSPPLPLFISPPPPRLLPFM